MTREHRLSLLKTLPGLLISVFFLWFTFVRRNAQGARPLNGRDFESIHLAAPAWIAGVVLFGIAGYTTRCYRWWRMLRHVHARFRACARVFLTALAANNILPLRIGDVMRIFTYAGDVNATPSIVMSTVLLEKLLDIFTLGTIFVVSMHFGEGVPPRLRMAAEAGIAISAAGLLVMVFGARTLEQPLTSFFARTKNARIAKLEHWLLLALDCIRQIGVLGTLWLVVCSFVAWTFESLMYISAAHLLGLRTDFAGPWQAVAQANLSFLIPSSPGGIGPFEWACKDALMRHGASGPAAGIFGLLIHVWLLVTLTAVGGALFLVHRFQLARRKPLIEEIEELPVALP